MALFFDLWGHKAIRVGHDQSQWWVVKDARSGVVLPSPSLAGIATFAARSVHYRREPVDVWTPPAETLARGFGDCEDFALLNRSLFIEAGGADKAVAVVVVRDRLSYRWVDGRAVPGWHAVAVFEDKFGPMMIDAAAPRAVRASVAKDYTPVLAYSADAAYTFGEAR